MNPTVNNILAAIMFFVAAYWICTTQQPMLIKGILIVGAYYTALRWLYEYYPETAVFIGKWSTLLILELVRGVCSIGSRR